MLKKKILPIGAAALVPVSYTHLDVYKRQPISTRAAAPIGSIFFFNIFYPSFILNFLF